MTKPILVKFGKRVRTIRAEQGISQERLGELAGVHKTYIRMVEQGEKNNLDPYATIELICNQFKRDYTMSKRYKDASPEEKREILSEALSNSKLLDRNIVDLQYKSPYDAFAMAPVNASFSEVLPDRDSVRSH
ncbi:helix-turn-helix transcriptional regulator [Candidatus Kaiserbacteria bacterium]|nr:helix-turn-helix transcriptional regulator [Candidatus Kaiserbacteria bacterium]MCB0370899.1 helix-turn-helix transcriptional regulator [Bdellovibrionales bacterium]